MPELILVVGLPGSGKSTWISNKYSYDRLFTGGITILSSDQVRQELYNDINDQTHNEEVFQYIKDKAVAKLELGHKVIIDATNLTRKSRKSITDYVEQNISGFYEFGYIRFVVIATPYYKCLENNRKRDRQVPEEVITRMYKHFEFPTYMESVHKIDIVYPFTIDKELYGMTPAYKNLMSYSHETPYHKMTVGHHMEETHNIMKVMSNNRVMLSAAELHDIGKPFCKQYIEEESGKRARFLNHANVGSYEAMFYAKQRKFSDEETYELCNLIQFHMRPYDLEDNDKSILKLKNTIGEKLYYKLLMLNIADKEAH